MLTAGKHWPKEHEKPNGCLFSSIFIIIVIAWTLPSRRVSARSAHARDQSFQGPSDTQGGFDGGASDLSLSRTCGRRFPILRVQR